MKAAVRLLLQPGALGESGQLGRGPCGFCSRGLGSPGEPAEVTLCVNRPPNAVLNTLSTPHSGHLRGINAAGCQ